MSTLAKRIGDLQPVANSKRKFGSNQAYYFVRLQMPDGSEGEYLFTESQLKIAKKRAIINPEDLLKPSKIRDALD